MEPLDPFLDFSTLDDFACASMLAEARWPTGFGCDRCGARSHYRIPGRPRVFECAGCGHQRSVTAGTLLERTRLPLAKWFQAAAMLLHDGGVSAAEVARKLGMSYEAAWGQLHKLRAGLPDLPGNDIVGPCEVAWHLVALKAPRGRFRDVADEARGVLVGSGDDTSFVVAPRSLAGRAAVQEVRARRSGEVVALPGLQRLLRSLSPRTGDVRRARTACARFDAKLYGVHTGVSAKWLPHYVRDFEFNENVAPAVSPMDVLAEALARGPRPFKRKGRYVGAPRITELQAA